MTLHLRVQLQNDAVSCPVSYLFVPHVLLKDELPLSRFQSDALLTVFAAVVLDVAVAADAAVVAAAVVVLGAVDPQVVEVDDAVGKVRLVPPNGDLHLSPELRKVKKMLAPQLSFN
jgi:hypothetical protein